MSSYEVDEIWCKHICMNVNFREYGAVCVYAVIYINLHINVRVYYSLSPLLSVIFSPASPSPSYRRWPNFNKKQGNSEVPGAISPGGKKVACV